MAPLSLVPDRASFWGKSLLMARSDLVQKMDFFKRALGAVCLQQMTSYKVEKSRISLVTSLMDWE